MTRDLRFGFYTEELRRCGAKAVVLGHHHGDLQVVPLPFLPPLRGERWVRGHMAPPLKWGGGISPPISGQLLC